MPPLLRKSLLLLALAASQPGFAEQPPLPLAAQPLSGLRLGADGELEGERIELLPEELPGGEGAVPRRSGPNTVETPAPKPPRPLAEEPASEPDRPLAGHPGIRFPSEPTPEVTVPTDVKHSENLQEPETAPKELPGSTGPASRAEAEPERSEEADTTRDSAGASRPTPATGAPNRTAVDGPAPASAGGTVRSDHIPVPQKTLTIRSLDELKTLRRELEQARQRAGGQ